MAYDKTVSRWKKVRHKWIVIRGMKVSFFLFKRPADCYLDMDLAISDDTAMAH